MAQNTLQRPSFYEGQILGSDDLGRTVEYAREQDARHERYLHTWGLTEGFEVVQQNDEWFLTPGFAIDSAGAPIVLADPMRLDFDQFLDDALPSEGDHNKLFPVFVVRNETVSSDDLLLQRCGFTSSSRTIEGAVIRFRPFVTGWDDQGPPGIADGPGEQPDQSRIVLVGFMQWKRDPRPRGSFSKFLRRDDNAGVGPKYAGAAADNVIARGGELALWSFPQKNKGAPAVVIGDHSPEEHRKALRVGLDDGNGNLNSLLSVDPKGNLFVKGNIHADGTIEGRLRKGDIAIESGIAGDGMTLPLPAGITYEQVTAGDVVLHTTVTPRLDRLVDPLNITVDHVPLVLECLLDQNLLVKCVIKWFKLSDLSHAFDVAGTVDYAVIAYVNKPAGGAA